ncbi:MAG: hypothetical protein IPJ00_03905 [Saprospirales bacterium]|nr:hypothetical protein [Saprospirales bacterium]
MTLIDQIRDMIAEGETERSLEELYKYVKENNADVIDTLVMLRSRMNGIQDEVSRGTMDSQSANLERAKINDAILKLLPQLTPEYMAKSAAWKSPRQTMGAAPQRSMAPTAPPSNKLKWLLIGGGAVLLLLVLVIALIPGENNDSFDTGFIEEGDAAGFMEETTTIDNQAPNNQTPDNQTQNTQTPDNLLDRVMGTYGGYAVWVTETNAEGSSSTFLLTETGTFQEYHGDQLFSEFQITEETPEYVSLYDAVRQLSLRIYESEVYVQNPNDPQWYKMANGQWVAPQ